MTDLCFTCEQNTSKLIRSANLPDREKSECVQIQQEHLNPVQDERELYRNACQEAKNNFEIVQDTIALDQHHEACSLDTTMHYSFDFAQQVHVPSNPMQPGPIYFKTPRKCGIFGVMCEAIPRQINYVIDEASDVGNGTNTTISYIISSKITDSAKLVCICTLTTAQDKTKTITLFGTLHGEQLINFTTLLNTHF